ncbi:MAG: hypothetical protein SGJ19_05075 [Planctomycetia bacterium]|nr:hypothetical protein [Planctomycetia bacterium]
MSLTVDQRNRDVRDPLEAIIARCQESSDPPALLVEQLTQLRGEFDRADLARMYREAVRRLRLYEDLRL